MANGFHGRSGGNIDVEDGAHGVRSYAMGAADYDAHGNITADGQRTFAYNQDDMPTQIAKGADTTTFDYAPDNSRIYREDKRGSEVTKTWYVGKGYELAEKAGTTEERWYLGNVVLSKSSKNSVLNYEVLHSDAQGSTVTVTDGQGALVSHSLYDAWGQQSVLQVGSTSQLFVQSLQRRGYTGHENVDGMGIIHMNGRIYDPLLARFVQADPTLQFPEYSQGYNRYAYVLNNPMTYTDPSGYFLAGVLKKYWRTALSIGLSIWAPWGTGLWASIATGAAAGVITTGSLKGALVGGLTAGLFHGVGTYFDGLKDASGALSAAARAGKVLAHGLVGGVSSVLGGGKFGDGFLSAGVTQALSFKIDEIGGRFGDVTSGSYYDTINRFKRIVAAAVVGGTTSALTGGKFANGAITAAFSRAFNDEAHWKQKIDEAWDDMWDTVSSTASEIWDVTVWNWNAVSDGLSNDASYGFWEAGVRITGGRQNLAFEDAYVRNWQQSSLALGFINNFDNKVVSFGFGGAFMQKHGGMSAFTWMKTGFKTAPHLLNRSHTAAYVARSTALNTILIGGAYEAGVGIGSAVRYFLNKGFIAGSDYYNDGKYKR